MKRFYDDVTVGGIAAGWEILLDGRPLRTPGRVPLALPSSTLAEAVAQEWRDAPEELDPASMLMTGMANAAIDRIAPDVASFAAGIGAYAESDLLCYRATAPQALVERQAAAWNPILDWAERRYDVQFTLTQGVMPVNQPAPTLARLYAEVAAMPAMTLAPMNLLTTISGSLVAALALEQRAFRPDTLWPTLILDELWEEEQWGSDDLAVAARANKERDWRAAAHFLDLVKGVS